MKNKKQGWSRMLAFGAVVGVGFLATGDSARMQTVTTNIGIDPLSILDLQIKPNVLIVLDTSGSMRFPPKRSLAGVNPANLGSGNNAWDTAGIGGVQVGGDDPVARMYQAKDALNQVLDANAGKFNFGFAQYGVRNQDKVLTIPGFSQDTAGGSGKTGPLVYVSMDANADTWTGGGTDWFGTTTSAAIDYNSTSAADTYRSFRRFNDVLPGPGCAAGTNCRRYLFSRLLRHDRKFVFDITQTPPAGLVSSPAQPETYNCPLPPVGLFPQDTNTDGDATRTDIERPCFRVETSTGASGADFFYTSGQWEIRSSGPSGCAAAAILENVAACASANNATIKAFLKPELPVDGSCGDTIGIPCLMTPHLNVVGGTVFQGTNPVGGSAPYTTANTTFGVQSAQGTPLAGVLNNVRTNFATYFPNVIAGQQNFVLLLTDGDESCSGDPAAEAASNYAATPRIETLVIGFGETVSALDAISNSGSGGTRPTAATATDTQGLIDAINQALTVTSVTGEFSDQQTITESVFEYGATATPAIDPRDPNTRYNKFIPLLLQSTFEMPGFVGHLNAFRNSGSGTSVQLWDAGDTLCKRVTGLPATTSSPPAVCNTAAAEVDATALGNRTASATYPTAKDTHVFQSLLPTSSGAPDYTPTGCSALNTRCIKRRIFATSRNGTFPYGSGVTPGANQLPSDSGPTVPLWPPSRNSTGVDPDKSGTTFPAGSLDVGLGINSLDLVTLQNTFGACVAASGDPLPTDCAGAAATEYARKEAREMILAYTAGAEVLRATNGAPRRCRRDTVATCTSSVLATPNTAWTTTKVKGQIRYRARTWMLGDATLSGAAVITPPIESNPGIGQPEYVLYRDGPRQSNGTPNTATGSQSDLGFGLRNPDKDANSATSAASKADVNLKPSMSIVYYGANDMLHAFRAGPQCAVVSPTTPSCTSGFETGGEELYGFIPFDLLERVRLLMLQGQDRANHKYMFATALRFAEVFVAGTYNDPNSVSRSGKWRTILFVGRGIGGKYYTALDVTRPGPFTKASLGTHAPQVLWNRGNPDTQDGTLAGTANSSTDDGTDDWTVTSGVASGAYSTMGQAWSVPALARVSPAATKNYGRDFVIYVGSGYGSTAGEGRRVYTLDPITGDALTSADVSSGTSSVITNNAVVANPAVFAKELLSPGITPHPAAQLATRVYVGDLHGRVWKFLTANADTPIQVRDFGVNQPIANAVALLNYNGDGAGAKPHVYVEMGNDRRVPPPPSVPPPPIFKLAGLKDDGADTDTTADNSTLLFSFDLPDRFRGTVQPATAFISTASDSPARVFMAATRFNPVTSSSATCQSTFDSLIFVVGAESGNAAYDLSGDSVISPTGDRSKQITGNRVNSVQVAFGQVTIDQGLNAQNAPPPPAPPPAANSATASKVFTLGFNAGGSSVCR